MGGTGDRWLTWLRELVNDDRMRDPIRRVIDERLKHDDVAHHIAAEVERRVNAEIGARVAQAGRGLRWLYAVVSLAGISVLAMLTFLAGYLSEQRVSVQNSLGSLALIPDVILRTGNATADFRNQQTVLESRNRRRWELDDRLEELDTLRVGMSRRLARLLELHIKGEISREALERRTEAVRTFSLALGLISDVVEYQDDKYRSRAPTLLGKAIFQEEDAEGARSRLLAERTAVKTYGEPRVRLASLLMTDFTDRPRLSSLFEAREYLVDARRIVTEDRHRFYAEDRYSDYLLAEIDYQYARFLYFLSGVCFPDAGVGVGTARTQVADAECQKSPDRPAEASRSAIARLEAAQERYRRWSRDGEGINHRYTYYKALLHLDLDKDLIKAEQFAQAAAKQAQQTGRGAEYFQALNQLAYVLTEGLQNHGSYSKREALEYYRKRRAEAITYAHRALAVVMPDSEQYARSLDTLGIALSNLGLDYQASVARFQAIQLVAKFREKRRREGHPSDALDKLLTRSCTDYLKHDASIPVPGPPTGGLEPYQARFYAGRRHQLRAFVQRTCTGDPLPAAKRKDVISDLKKAHESFSEATIAARGRNGFSMRAEVALAVNRSWLAHYAPSEVGEVERKWPSNPVLALDHLEENADFLKNHFVGAVMPTMRNNLAWEGLLSRRESVGFRPTADNVVAIAVEAVTETKWEDADLLHTLAAALYQKATGIDAGKVVDKDAFQQGLSLVVQLLADAPNDKGYRKLRGCFDVAERAAGPAPAVRECLDLPTSP
jgi:hypothetical protein